MIIALGLIFTVSAVMLGVLEVDFLFAGSNEQTSPQNVSEFSKKEETVGYEFKTKEECELMEFGGLLYRDQCYLDLAESTFMETYCGEIVDPDSKNYCLGVVRKEPELCRNITNEKTKTKCIEKAGV